MNLAAIDEFKEQSERKEYLDRQFKDLTDALETLEAAIRKIDRETRARFQDTFDRVNAGLKERFPRLFGGGHAYLELAGEDILNAGVSIMARPPGKRNSTINQLSGGEKALTAVALVFSIFELNPAPFCLLDEVDAPLDDNNVGRFCDTVQGHVEPRAVHLHHAQQDDDGAGLAADRRDHERAGRVAPGRGGRRRSGADGRDVAMRDDELRWILIGFGIVLLAAIYLWGRRGSRAVAEDALARRPSLLRAPVASRARADATSTSRR